MSHVFASAAAGIPGHLFSKSSLADYLARLQAELRQQVAAWPPDELLQTPEADVIAHLTDKYSRECPVLDTEGVWVKDEDEEVHREVPTHQFGGRMVVRHTQITIMIPFTGDPEIFRWTPSQHRLAFVKAAVVDHHVCLQWEGGAGDAQQINAWVLSVIAEIQEWLGWSYPQVSVHNLQVAELARGQVAARRAELLSARSLRASIGFPMRKRADAAALTVPLTRRRISPRPLPAASGRFQPEWAMSDDDYEEAIRVLINQRNALERSPSTVAAMGEEAIRDQLLVGLNGQFEGQAAGEVFNGAGKTDILIRVQDRHVFIGECKIWKGPKTVPAALDQLLSYLVWRDTKAALLLFIRRGAPSEIITKALAEIEEHPNFKRTVGRNVEHERYNFIFRANGDPGREIQLAFLPFALPQAEANAS